jgi:hypothetical protein
MSTRPKQLKASKTGDELIQHMKTLYPNSALSLSIELDGAAMFKN